MSADVNELAEVLDMELKRWRSRIEDLDVTVFYGDLPRGLIKIRDSKVVDWRVL